MATNTNRAIKHKNRRGTKVHLRATNGRTTIVFVKGDLYMKATGIVRRIDDLGRVVIPKEIRRTMRIREGDPLEITPTARARSFLKSIPPLASLHPLPHNMLKPCTRPALFLLLFATVTQLSHVPGSLARSMPTRLFRTKWSKLLRGVPSTFGAKVTLPCPFLQMAVPTISAVPCPSSARATSQVVWHLFATPPVPTAAIFPLPR